ncbi:MAG: hypothetical protein ACK4F7_10755, partial [Inhella sp.]
MSIETDVVHLVSLRAHPHTVERLADLRGLRIGVGNGISHALQRLRVLIASRLDAVLIPGGLIGIESAIASDPALRAQRDALLIAPRPLVQEPLHLAFPS